MNKEPRYHVMKTGIFDHWEKRFINETDSMIGHECTYELPEKFMPNAASLNDFCFILANQ